MKMDPKCLGHSEIPDQPALDRWHEQNRSPSHSNVKPLIVLGYFLPSATYTIVSKIPGKSFQEFSPLSKCKGEKGE